MNMSAPDLNGLPFVKLGRRARANVSPLRQTSAAHVPDRGTVSGRATLPKSVGPPTIFARGEKLAISRASPANTGRKIMRFLRSALAGACAFGLFGVNAATAAEPVKIRMSWGAPVGNWESITLGKKDLAKHMGKSYAV